MTKGGSNKPTMLGRLIFGEKRKQHASPSRHRSTTRNDTSIADVSSSGGGGPGVSKKNLINVHDWAVWRMHLNEQMGHGVADRTDLKHMRQFLHSNPFYQQHSRDPSNGRYNGVRLMFSIPHAKIKPELIDASRVAETVPITKTTNVDTGDSMTYETNNIISTNDDHTLNSVASVSVGSSFVGQKSMSQALPKNLIANTNHYRPIHESMATNNNVSRARRSIRMPFTAVDRVHATLQKAVKDGNVLEKIKAFEMQAAAAQAESAAKLVVNSNGPGIGNGGNFAIPINHRMHLMTSPIQSVAHRALSPTITHPIQNSISPIPMSYESQHNYIRSHRSRHVYPTREHHEVSLGPIGGRQSRKGTHVLEPALGDIILKRRTPSQKTVNDEDYSMTVMSSMALPVSHGHNHRQHHSHHQHHHHRASASRSRHRKEPSRDRRASSVHENVPKKSQQKQKEKEKEKEKETKSSSSKPSTRHRWLRSHKDSAVDTETENVKEKQSSSKSKKNNKSKKKDVEQEKNDSADETKSSPTKGKISSDNNRVYGVPNTNANEQTKFETISPQPPPRIDEENESDRDEEKLENKIDQMSAITEENIVENKKSDTNIERPTSSIQLNKKLSSTDADILSKVEDENRFSRPTDDHAHRSELLDEDDACKSEGDVFIEESPLTNTNTHHQQQQQQQQQQQSLSVNAFRRHSSQCSADKIPTDRRWQWSKESGGLVEKLHSKKKQLKSTPSLITKEERVIYETPKSEKIQRSTYDNYAINKKQSFPTTASPHDDGEEQCNNKKISKQILHAILNSMSNNQDQSTVNEFFENGPYTNPEETMANIASTA